MTHCQCAIGEGRSDVQNDLAEVLIGFLVQFTGSFTSAYLLAGLLTIIGLDQHFVDAACRQRNQQFAQINLAVGTVDHQAFGPRRCTGDQRGSSAIHHCAASPFFR